MNTKKILKDALKGLVEGSKWYIKLSDVGLEPTFMDDITDYFTEIIFHLEPLDDDTLYDTIHECTYDLARKGTTEIYIDTGLNDEHYEAIPVNNVDELVDLMMAQYFPHKSQ